MEQVAKDLAVVGAAPCDIRLLGRSSHCLLNLAPCLSGHHCTSPGNEPCLTIVTGNKHGHGYIPAVAAQGAGADLTVHVGSALACGAVAVYVACPAAAASEQAPEACLGFHCAQAASVDQALCSFHTWAPASAFC